MKALADDKINVPQSLNFGLGRLENIKWEKEKKLMLVTRMFSFSQNVFKRPLPQRHLNPGFCGTESRPVWPFAIINFKVVCF